MGAPLELHWRHPGGERLLFWIHGYGEHPSGALQIAAILDPEQRYRLCSPSGGVNVGHHRLAFYRVDFEKRQVDPASFAAGLEALDDAIDAACRSHGCERSEVVLGGFSQGGSLAMAAALRRSERPPPAGIVLFNMLMYPDDVVSWDLGRCHQLDVFWAHGLDDDIFGIEGARSSAGRLTDAGARLAFNELDVGHVLSPEGLALARDWLKER